MRKVRVLSAVLRVTHTSKAFSIIGNSEATKFILGGAQLIGVS